MKSLSSVALLLALLAEFFLTSFAAEVTHATGIEKAAYISLAA